MNELTRYVALIGAKTLREYGLNPQFKYPNDILINGKKIAGFLAESEFIGQTCKGVIVGCGINLNLDSEELKNINIPATSIFNETGKQVNKSEFLNKFLSNFKQDYDDFLINGIKGEKKNGKEKDKHGARGLACGSSASVIAGYGDQRDAV